MTGTRWVEIPLHKADDRILVVLITLIGRKRILFLVSGFPVDEAREEQQKHAARGGAEP